MNTHGTEAGPTLGPPSAAVHALLKKVARLCALAEFSEDVAVQVFRAAYSDARELAGASGRVGEEGGVDTFVAAQVLGEWHQNSAFLDKSGNPKALAISAGDFTRLCRTASVQASPDQVMKLLEEAGAITVAADEVTARRRELIMDYAHPSAVTRAIHLSAEFASTLHHNLSRNVREPGRFERTVVSNKLARRQLPSLLAYLSVHGQSFLEDLDAWMSARESVREGPTVGVGVYLFVGEDKV